MPIPLFDMSTWSTGSPDERARLARDFDDICRRHGFLILSGHGVDLGLIEQMRAVTYGFFDLPLERKLAVASNGHTGGRGYYSLQSKSHARTLGDTKAPGDLRETFFAGTEPDETRHAGARFVAPNLWSDEPASMKPLWDEYFAQCQRTAETLLNIAAHALDLPGDWFRDKIDAPISTMAAQHYPAQDADPLPGQIRSGAHTDFGTLTLLMTEDRPGGLQIRTDAGAWEDVRPVANCFIVNLGDLMALWTNDRWRSTLHRVVNPPRDTGSSARRLSLVYFHQPNDDARIECIPSCTDAAHPPLYPAVLSGDHLAAKLRATDSVRPTRAGD